MPIQVALDQNGAPVNGAKLYFYLAGTSTPAVVYSDVGLTTSITQPITADSYGRFQAYYTTPGTSYKVDLQTPGSVSFDGYPQDNVPSIPLGSGNVDVTGTAGESIAAGNAVYLSAGDGSKNAGQWYKADNANAYSSTSNNVGIATAAIAAAATGTIRQIGSLGSIGPFTAGAVQYIGTAGALTATRPSSNIRQMGQADTTSSLVIQPAPSATTGQVTTYAATIANVGPSSTTETTALSFVVPANAMADGDVIVIQMTRLLKNNNGGTPTTTEKINVGAGAQVVIVAQAWADSATEYTAQAGLVLQRVGSTVWVLRENPYYPNSNQSAQQNSSYTGNSTPTNFTSDFTVSWKITLGASDATYYVKPQSAKVIHYKV